MDDVKVFCLIFPVKVLCPAIFTRRLIYIIEGKQKNGRKYHEGAVISLAVNSASKGNLTVGDSLGVRVQYQLNRQLVSFSFSLYTLRSF